MERWAVTLEGEALDLKHVAHLLGCAGPSGVRVGTITTPAGQVLPALFSGSFDTQTEHSDVHEEARRLLDLINGLILLTDQSREPLRLGTIHPRDGDAWGIGYLLLAGRAKGRSWASGSLSKAGDPPHVPPEVRWVALAQQEVVVGDVLRFLKAPEPDWLDLFMASELLESAAGQPWWPKAAFEKFTANSQEGRHARGPYENLPLSRRMDLRQARRFVAELARQWLDWWIVDEVGARTASCENERRKRKERPGKSGR